MGKHDEVFVFISWLPCYFNTQHTVRLTKLIRIYKIECPTREWSQASTYSLKRIWDGMMATRMCTSGWTSDEMLLQRIGKFSCERHMSFSRVYVVNEFATDAPRRKNDATAVRHQFFVRATCRRNLSFRDVSEDTMISPRKRNVESSIYLTDRYNRERYFGEIYINCVWWIESATAR